MKHLPNFITLLNLLFGCCSIVSSLTAHPYFTTQDHDNQYLQITGMEDLYMGAIFIFLAAAMDMLDGLAARILNAESAIGEMLDSLADIVSFGVAPGVILYQMMWYAYISNSNAFEQPTWALLPAFFITLMGALRLAKFNTYKDALPKNYFIGLPIPAAGLFVAALPLILFFGEIDAVRVYLSNRWVLYGISIALGLLMVSKIKFRKWNSGIKSLSKGWPIYFSAIVFVVTIILLPYMSVFLTMLTYMILSIIVPYKGLDAETNIK